MSTTGKNPTKKQREMLTFITNFIAGHGYSPSYREIMRGLGYKSIASVALHVDNLIVRGLLRKADNQARSLEVVGVQKEFQLKRTKASDEKWLVEQVQQKFALAESAATPSQQSIDELFVLVGALKILEFESAYLSFAGQLAELRKRVENNNN